MPATRRFVCLCPRVFDEPRTTPRVVTARSRFPSNLVPRDDDDNDRVHGTRNTHGPCELRRARNACREHSTRSGTTCLDERRDAHVVINRVAGDDTVETSGNCCLIGNGSSGVYSFRRANRCGWIEESRSMKTKTKTARLEMSFIV